MSSNFGPLILDQYYFKSHTGNDTSVYFQYWYSVFCLGTATYTDAPCSVVGTTPALEINMSGRW